MVQCRPDGREVSASFSSDHIYIFDPKVRKINFYKS